MSEFITAVVTPVRRPRGHLGSKALMISAPGWFHIAIASNFVYYVRISMYSKVNHNLQMLETFEETCKVSVRISEFIVCQNQIYHT